jgi:hypothetical protein
MTKNILILIDIWDKFDEDTVQKKKKNICEFINHIADHPDWIIYYNDVDSELDSKVANCLLTVPNAVCTNDPSEVFCTRDYPVTYYYGGFAANVCLLYRSIGICQMFKRANDYKFYIVSDFTCATKIKYEFEKDHIARLNTDIDLFDLENLKYYKIDDFDNNTASHYYDYENILITALLSNKISVNQILLG